MYNIHEAFRSKVKRGSFTGSDIRKFLKQPSFVEIMNEKEKEAWVSYLIIIRYSNCVDLIS